jgi:hypothetical protein
LLISLLTNGKDIWRGGGQFAQVVVVALLFVFFTFLSACEYLRSVGKDNKREKHCHIRYAASCAASLSNTNSRLVFSPCRISKARRQLTFRVSVFFFNSDDVVCGALSNSLRWCKGKIKERINEILFLLLLLDCLFFEVSWRNYSFVSSSLLKGAPFSLFDPCTLGK